MKLKQLNQRFALCLVVLITLAAAFTATYTITTVSNIGSSPSKLTTQPWLRDTDALTFRSKTCPIVVHETIGFKCYTAQRRDAVQHDYSVAVLFPKKLQTLATDSQRSKTALVSIPGGPGQGNQTSESWLMSWAGWMDSHNVDVPLIVYEPPGTAGSSAFFYCDEYQKKALSLAAKPLSYAEEALALMSTTAHCLERYDARLIEQGFSKRGISSLNSFDVNYSLSLLLDAIQANAIHLLGTSYGTRVALLSAAHTRVMSLTLDSVYPFKHGTILDWPLLLGNAFELHQQSSDFQIYKDTGRGEYKTLLQAAYNHLLENPQSWTLQRWDGQPDVDFVLTADRLLFVHFSVLYNSEMLAYFYYALAHIEQKTDELRWVLEDVVTNIFDPTFNSLLYLAVECNDNAVVDKQTFMAASRNSLDTLTDWQAFYDDDACQLDALKSSLSAKKIQNLEYTQKPTLILAGELDPVTPAKWASELLASMPWAELYTAHNMGHSLLSDAACLMPSLMRLWRSESIYEINEALILSDEDRQSCDELFKAQRVASDG